MTQAAAPMAPKVIKVAHAPNTRQGVNTQVREIPLLPTHKVTAFTPTLIQKGSKCSCFIR